MKFAVSSYSFQKLLQSGEMNQLSCVKKARDLGFDAVEFTDLQPHDGASIRDYAARIREESERCGLPVSNFTVGADFLRNDPHREAERLCKLVDVAVLLGTDSMRHDASVGWPEGEDRSFEEALPRLAEGCRAVAAYAAERGVRTMVENHGFFCQDSQRVERLIQAVNRPNFGWLVDMGNFLCADEDPLSAVERAAPYAFYAHAKDFYVRPADGPDPGAGFFRSRRGAYLRGAVFGQGDVCVAGCLQRLRRGGYDGFIGLEFEGMEDPLWAILAGLENLRRAAEG